jgi:hypothetical protein
VAGSSEELDALKKALEALTPLDAEGRARGVAWLASALEVSGAPAGATGVPGAPGNVSDSKGFLASKRPQSDIQRIACLAYILTHGKGTTAFNTEQLREVNVEAAGRTFSNISDAAKNAVKAGLLSSAGGRNRQITAPGERVVNALPDQAAVKAVLGEEKRPRRRRRKK